MADQAKSAGAFLVTLLTAALAIWWLWEVSQRLGTAPTLDAEGNVTVDAFQRAKDILLVVLPLFSGVVAFWVGSSGTAAAKEEAKESKEKLDAVIDASPEGVLKKAREMHPTAFE